MDAIRNIRMAALIKQDKGLTDTSLIFLYSNYVTLQVI